MNRSRTFGLLIFLALVVIVYATRQALVIAPTDALQGNSFRILYYHVPHSMLSMVWPYVNLAGALGVLYWRQRDSRKAQSADALAIAGAEVTLVYATICLVTGMLWGRTAWGIWWTWDWRLTSMLLLWMLYVSYMILRKLSSTGQSQTLAAVLSVFAAIDVPIVYMSIRWWRTQHPSPIFFSGDPDSKLDKTMMPAFLWNFAAWTLWGLLLLTMRYSLQRRRQQREEDALLRTIEPTAEAVRG